MTYRLNRLLDVVQYLAFTIAGICGVVWAILALAPVFAR